MRTFVIPVRDLSASGVERVFEATPEWLVWVLAGSDLRAVGPGRVEVRASSSGRDVLIRGRVEVSLVGACVRCLEAAPILVRSDIDRLYTPVAPPPAPAGRRGPAHQKAPPEPEEGEEELNVEDDVDTFDGETVVLDEAVREHILLEVPMNPLCRPECPGLLEAGKPQREGPFASLKSLVLPEKKE